MELAVSADHKKTVSSPFISRLEQVVQKESKRDGCHQKKTITLYDMLTTYFLMVRVSIFSFMLVLNRVPPKTGNTPPTEA